MTCLQGGITSNDVFLNDTPLVCSKLV